MKTLYFDCFSGAAGDMILGALIDAGLSLEELRGALGSLAVDRDALWTERVVRAGISATRFRVRGEDGDHHHADHHHHHHSHRTLADINCLINRSSLSPAAKERSRELFARLGEAEAAIHGTTLDQVHLHEVGSLDSVIEIVGAV